MTVRNSQRLAIVSELSLRLTPATRSTLIIVKRRT